MGGFLSTVSRCFFILWVAIVGLLLASPQQLFATVYTVAPVSDPVTNYNTLQNNLNLLRAGDILELQGDAANVFEISKGLKVSGCIDIVHVTNCPANKMTVMGTVAAPIIVRAASGSTPVIVYKGSTANIFDLSRTQYFVIDGIEFTQTPGGEQSGIDGIKVYDSEHVTLQNNHVHHIGGVALNFKSSLPPALMPGVNAFHKLYHNHLHHTSINTAEGIYLGCSNSADCYVHDIEVDQNWIHNTGGTQGDGVEVKLPSYAVTITDNVIHDTHYPGITMYGFPTGQCIVAAQRSRVERNVVFNGLNSGIEIDGPGIVTNNIIFGNALHGIQSRKNPDCLQDLEIVNNTIIDNGGNNLDLRNWGGSSGMVLANNASYILGLAGPATGTAYFSQAMTGVNIVGNVFFGTVTGISANNYILGGGAGDFVDPAHWDFWPLSASLKDLGNNAIKPNNDFSENSRDTTPDIGAYEAIAATNPGWAIAASFKNESTSNGSGTNIDNGNLPAPGDGSTSNSTSALSINSSGGCGTLAAVGHGDSMACLLLLVVGLLVTYSLRKAKG